MKKSHEYLIVGAVIAASLIIAIIGYIILPDMLVLQITISGESGTTLPKIIGISIPLIINIGACYMYLKSKNKTKYIIALAAGMLIFMLTFVFNLK